MKKGFVLLVLVAAAMLVIGCAAPTPTTGGTTGGGGTTPAECATEGACVVIDAGQPLKLGASGPTTGENANFGIDVQRGAEMALKDYGDFEGFKIELVVEDDLGSPEGGSAAAQKLTSDPSVVAVVGHSFSGATNAALPIYEKANVPIMSPSATRIDLGTQGYKTFNRVVASDFFQGQKDAEFLTGLGVKNLAIIHDGSPYGQGLATRVQEVYTDAGGTVVAFVALTVGETDFSSVLNEVASKSPDGVFFGGYQPEAAVLANQRAAAGLDKVPFVSGDGVFGDSFLELAKANAEGYYVSQGVPPGSDSITSFGEKYKAAYGDELGKLSGYAPFAYDATNVLLAAVKSVAVVGSDGKLYIPRAALVAAARATKGFTGVIGDITCNEIGECSPAGIAGFSMFHVKSGKFEEVK